MRPDHDGYLAQKYLNLRLLILNNELAVASLNLADLNPVDFEVFSGKINAPSIFIFLTDDFLQLFDLDINVDFC